MKICRTVVFLIGLSISVRSLGQTFNTNNGDWNVGTNWSTSSVPSGATTAVTIAQNVIVNSPNNDVIGATTIGNNTNVTVNSGATLTLGASGQYPGTPESLDYSNSGTLTVAGTLYIYGDLVVGNTLTLNVTGTMIVFGNVTMSNGGSLTVSGSGTLQVGGNVAGGNNTQIATTGSGTIAVTGSISTGGGTSSISGPGGSITAGSCDVNGTACPGTVTPVTLLSFNSMNSGSQIVLKWTTASELNFDYFDLEKSGDGLNFNSISHVKGHGTTNEKNSYEYEDNFPLIGKNYYRLTSVDFDNYRETFQVIMQNYSGEKEFQISPNPTDGLSLNLNFNFDESKGLVAIYDNMGSLVGSFQVKESSKVSFSNPLKGGIYLAKYSSPSFTKAVRFLVK